MICTVLLQKVLIILDVPDRHISAELISKDVKGLPKIMSGSCNFPTVIRNANMCKGERFSYLKEKSFDLSCTSVKP